LVTVGAGDRVFWASGILDVQGVRPTPDWRILICAGVLFLFGGVLLHGLLDARNLIVHIPVLNRLPPGLLAHLPASAPQGVEGLIRILVLAACTLLIELGIVGWESSSLRSLCNREKKISRDFALMLLCAIQAVPVLSAVASFGATYVVSRFGGYAAQFAVLSLVPSVALQFGLLVVIRSFVAYWQHRICHTNSFLWQFHRFHHAAPEMNGLNDYRATPLVVAMTGGPGMVVVQLLGKPHSHDHLTATIAISLYIFYFAAIDLYAHVVHTRWDTSFGWLGRHVLVSPAYHRIHHSALQPHKDKNFSPDLVIWDRLFGTYFDPETVPDRIHLPLVFEGSEYDKGSFFYDYYLRSVRDSIVALTANLGIAKAPDGVRE
jgi:sterol desaturase/sphingolipid hydroxylase (fatty acid hydroxylase superfamily)